MDWAGFVSFPPEFHAPGSRSSWVADRLNVNKRCTHRDVLWCHGRTSVYQVCGAHEPSVPRGGPVPALPVVAARTSTATPTPSLNLTASEAYPACVPVQNPKFCVAQPQTGGIIRKTFIQQLPTPSNALSGVEGMRVRWIRSIRCTIPDPWSPPCQIPVL